ncbi:MAG: YciI family protein [Litoreibacter sp.]|nr:YciI family protein [Litoreibacter sp.]
MNHWIVYFQDNPEMLVVREKHFADHVAYLTSQPDIFVDGTSLSATEDAAPTGGMWIVKANSRDKIVRLIEGDPMFQSGHRTYEIFATGKVLSTK